MDLPPLVNAPGFKSMPADEVQPNSLANSASPRGEKAMTRVWSMRRAQPSA